MNDEGAIPVNRPGRFPYWLRPNGTPLRRQRVIAPEIKTRALFFVRLRWFIPPVTIGAAMLAHVLGFRFDLIGVLVVAGFTFTYNTLLFYLGKRIDRLPTGTRWIYFYTYSQVILDFASVFPIAYCTGGAASPIVFFFIFHIVFASILLTARSAFVFASIVVICMALMIFGSAAGALPYQSLSFRGDDIDFAGKPWYLTAMLIFFSTAIFTTAASSTAIMRILRRRIDENNDACREIEHLTADRWRFMLKAAHNLRAPITAMVSMLEVIKNHYYGPVPPAQQEHLRRIDRRARSMAAMIDDLMGIAKTRTGNPASPVPMPIGEIAGRIARTFEDEALQKGLGFTISVSEEIRDVTADLEVLEPVLENLLSNAIKYTTQGEVRVAFERVDTDLKIRVEDTGIGIPSEDRNKLFTEFFRAKNAKLVEEIGNGLGLALVRQTLKQGGGRIDVESKEGKGTRFVVYLPCPDRRQSV